MRTVVVGVDSEQSKQVLIRAVAEARTIGRPLQVLTAWTTPTWAGGTVGLDDPEAVRAGRAAAQELAEGLLAEALHTRVEGRPVSASASGSFGDAGDVLVRAGVDAGLVVVGARSHGPLLSAFLGSTTSRVLHHASCPVMVVSRGVATGPYRRVVVGFDEPAGAGSALHWGLDAARRHGCPLVVLHALSRTLAPTRRAAQERDAHREDDVHTWLAGEVARASRRYTDVPLSLTVHDGTPLDVLLGQTRPDDLLVLGSRLRTRLSQVLLGAVAVQCAQQATGTIVVVRAGQERLDDPAADLGDTTRDERLVTHGR